MTLKNTDLQNRREQAVPRGVATLLPKFAARASNSEIWDVEGKRYIDFASGIAVLNTGHNHPKIIEAMGKLHFRTSFGQNVLRHSVEVAFLSQIIRH